jgi:hypothetical protein
MELVSISKQGVSHEIRRGDKIPGIMVLVGNKGSMMSEFQLFLLALVVCGIPAATHVVYRYNKMRRQGR